MSRLSAQVAGLNADRTSSRRSGRVPETQKRRRPKGHRRFRETVLCQVLLRTWLHAMKPISLED